MHRSVCLRLSGLAIALAAMVPSTPTAAAENDGFVMGAGRWTCAEVIEAADNGDAAANGQAAGWVLGYWSAATFARETGFVDLVEQVGGRTIYQQTVAECRKAPAETMLYRVTKSMISNTK